MIVGQPTSTELQLLSTHQKFVTELSSLFLLNVSDFIFFAFSSVGCNLVTLDWLAASITERQPSNERTYLFKLTNHMKPSPDQEQPTVASPASKKNIQSMNKSMNSTFRKPLVPRRLDMAENDENNDQDLLQQYLVAAPTEPSAGPVPLSHTAPKATIPTSDGSTNQTQTIFDGDSQAINSELLKGLTFHLHGFVEDSEEQLDGDIALHGGLVVSESYARHVNYLLVPTDIMQLTIKLRAEHIVNEHWIVSS